jgi:hypothetical protein
VSHDAPWFIRVVSLAYPSCIMFAVFRSLANSKPSKPTVNFSVFFLFFFSLRLVTVMSVSTSRVVYQSIFSVASRLSFSPYCFFYIHCF